ncbi:hypothetical protein GLOTRDRAFT_125450 [Gloeophyllum trabeum ATCC 11539]|uniref:Uncharacterized protein n=1 Tax=Gloeophyllum trabeum (strain ATCC 11539 / FP-39264 / Madison 617) TaxID=670483 RepID=S7S0A5_GLOTA|nr:uncharacterized protein GLOTRDRAFT_125450 [Gloeophyllum trabeum ATCC 11539]EPQ59139.1 hypothetical protein GLOTRDRAFT_125450 [Gloeophyllum trabeum ATCC 11539]
MPRQRPPSPNGFSDTEPPSSEVESDSAQAEGHESEANGSDLAAEAGARKHIERLSKAELIAELQASQLREGKALKDVKRLVGQVAELKLKLRNRKERGKEVPAAILARLDDIAMCGRKYNVMHDPWPNAELFSRARPEGEVVLIGPRRFLSDKMREAAIVEELYMFLPENLHEMIGPEGHSSFTKEFRQKGGNSRASLVHKLSTQAVSIFKCLGVTENHLADGNDRANCPELQRLLKYDTTSPKYPSWLPVLFEGVPRHFRESNLKYVFRNRALFNLLWCVLWGKLPTGSSNKPRGGPDTNGKKWNVTSITPGAIAWAAIAAIYLLSPDTEFSATGKTTHINYSELFTRYKNSIIAGMDNQSVQDTISMYNRFLFSSAFISLDEVMQTGSGDENGEDFVEDFVRALDAVDQSEEDDNVNDLAAAVGQRLSVIDHERPAEPPEHTCLSQPSVSPPSRGTGVNTSPPAVAEPDQGGSSGRAHSTRGSKSKPSSKGKQAEPAESNARKTRSTKHR